MIDKLKPKKYFSLKWKITISLILILVLSSVFIFSGQKIINHYSDNLTDTGIINIYNNIQTGSENNIKTRLGKTLDGFISSDQIKDLINSGDTQSLISLVEGTLLNYEISTPINHLVLLTSGLEVTANATSGESDKIKTEFLNIPAVKTICEKSKQSSKYESAWIDFKGNPRFCVVNSIIDNEGKLIGYLLASISPLTVVTEFSEILNKKIVMEFEDNKKNVSSNKELNEALKPSILTKDKELKSYNFSYSNEVLKIHVLKITDSEKKVIALMHIAADNKLEASYKSGMSMAFIIFLIATVIISGLLMLILLSRVLKPLYSIEKSLKEIASGSGDLSAKIIATSNDEFGKLSGHFNDFVSSIREMVLKILGITDNLASSSLQLSSSSESFAVNAVKQKELTDDSLDGINELSKSTENILKLSSTQNDNIKKISEVIIKLMSSIKEVDTYMKKFLITNNQTADLVKKDSSKIKQTIEGMSRLNESSIKIREIVEIINDISEQINLLSLNAAIEAARAGEHGRGFAVVADEISKLADQTSSSTKEIEKIIKEMVGEVSNEQMLINGTAESLNTIFVTITKSNEELININSIISNHSDQASVITEKTNELNVSLDSIISDAGNLDIAAKSLQYTIGSNNDLASQVASGSEELSATSEELASNAEQLKNLVNEFKID